MICGGERSNLRLRAAAEIPGFSRPIIAIVLPQRLVSGLSGKGKYRSKWLPGAKTDAKSNDAGSTPTTVMRLVVQCQRRADDGRIRVEAPLPEPVTEHHGLRPVPRHSSALKIRPSWGGRRARRRSSPTPARRSDARARPSAEQVVADAVEREVAGDRRQRLRALPQIEHVPDLRRLAGQSAGVAVGDPDQLLGSAKGNGRSSSVLTTLKTVALAPMPSPAMRMAKVAKPASRRSVRTV